MLSQLNNTKLNIICHVDCFTIYLKHLFLSCCLKILVYTKRRETKTFDTNLTQAFIEMSLYKLNLFFFLLAYFQLFSLFGSSVHNVWLTE